MYIPIYLEQLEAHYKYMWSELVSVKEWHTFDKNSLWARFSLGSRKFSSFQGD